jgi:hypothetical protein
MDAERKPFNLCQPILIPVSPEVAPLILVSGSPPYS